MNRRDQRIIALYKWAFPRFVNKPVWVRVLENFEAIKSKYLSLPQTFNYNDFAFENPAFSRHSQQAVINDYIRFATGTAASDWRKVISSLCGAAKPAVQEAYGHVDEAAMVLDRPLYVLDGLVVASQRPRQPGWAHPLLVAPLNGELVESISAALSA